MGWYIQVIQKGFFLRLEVKSTAFWIEPIIQLGLKRSCYEIEEISHASVPRSLRQCSNGPNGP